MVMKNVVFVDAVRTPFGKMGGGLRSFYPSELAGIAVKAMVDRSGIVERGGKWVLLPPTPTSLCSNASVCL